ncbi:MAG TPA: hypothetical protein VK474_00185, partial [Chthoniobacterales bacterium]|nr:hypothetical protein [Chthoniobacterales bacterium]
QYFDSMSCWSAWALFAAMAWERSPRELRMAGLALTALAGAAVTGAAALNFNLLPPIPPDLGLSVKSVLILAGACVLFFALIAAYFSARDRETLALALVLLGMVPVGLAAAEGLARYGKFLSFANAAGLLQQRLGERGEVLFEDSPLAGSSLNFYLDRPPLLVQAAAGPGPVIEKLARRQPVYLIIRADRVPYWQEELTERFHLYHQEAICGNYVIVSNEP